jgi:hypothetical protein
VVPATTPSPVFIREHAIEIAHTHAQRELAEFLRVPLGGVVEMLRLGTERVLRIVLHQTLHQ